MVQGVRLATAVIEGVATDPSGAVLPGVDVEIRNADTNLTRTLVPIDTGRGCIYARGRDQLVSPVGLAPARSNPRVSRCA